MSSSTNYSAPKSMWKFNYCKVFCRKFTTKYFTMILHIYLTQTVKQSV